MNKHTKQIVTIVTLCLCSSISYGVHAETGSVTGGPDGNMTSSARLKLRVIIPRFLQFQVGNAGPSVDTISFQPAANAVGNGIAVAGTGGDASSSSGASVVLRSNAGRITIVADNDGGGLGSSGAISLSEITAHSDSSNLQTPQLSDSGATTTTATPTGGDVTDRRATWSYSYNNSRAVEPGNYDAEIIYTAVSP